MSFAGIAPKNHPKQVAVRTRQSSLFGDPTDGVDDRRTPRAFFDPLHDRFRFTVDAAASVDNALLPRFWTRTDSGLSAPWSGERVWCNPPYSAIPAWVAKAWRETRRPESHLEPCHCAVLLLPADRTEQPWWQDHIEPYRDRGKGITTEFVRKRVKFGLPPDHPNANKGLAQGRKGGGYRYPPFGCVLVIFAGGVER
jgi:phage N-6-adenine-methyltransferase